MPGQPDHVFDFPTLWVALDWIEQHCVIPDGFDRGKPFRLSDWQAWCTANWYRTKHDPPSPNERRPGIGLAAMHYRRALIVLPQKAGKGPWSAAIVLNEGVGPSMFSGWAEGGEVYRCVDHRCPCGWVYTYEPGEAMGIPRPTALIQMTAYSYEQVGNVYDALRPMVDYGPLADVIRATGEEFTRLPDGGRIDVVTSSAKSRLGQRVTFVMQDEVGIWLAQNKMDDVDRTQRRGTAGMDGRVLSTTNAWDPSENSVGQQSALAATRNDDIFVYHPQAPPGLSYTDKRERRRIHRVVYAGCPWVDLDNIESESAELVQQDAANAERFFGNRIVAGLGAWIDEAGYQSSRRREIGCQFTGEAPDGLSVAGGFDGSESDDWTGIRLETEDGYQFTPRYGPDKRPTIWDPAEWGGSIPRAEVHAALEEIAARWTLRRFQCDPREWRSEIGDWALRYGEEVVFEFDTYAVARMWPALDRYTVDLGKRLWLDASCAITKEHILNARKAAKGVAVDPANGTRKQKYILVKPDRHRKIDMAMVSVLAHAAAAELHAGAAWGEPSSHRRAVGKRFTSR